MFFHVLISDSFDSSSVLSTTVQNLISVCLKRFLFRKIEQKNIVSTSPARFEGKNSRRVDTPSLIVQKYDAEFGDAVDVENYKHRS